MEYDPQDVEFARERDDETPSIRSRSKSRSNGSVTTAC